MLIYPKKWLEGIENKKHPQIWWEIRKFRHFLRIQFSNVLQNLLCNLRRISLYTKIEILESILLKPGKINFTIAWILVSSFWMMFTLDAQEMCVIPACILFQSSMRLLKMWISLRWFTKRTNPPAWNRFFKLLRNWTRQGSRHSDGAGG